MNTSRDKVPFDRAVSRYVALFFLICFVSFFSDTVRAGSEEGASKEPKFFSMLQDIPLMPGLTEVEDGAISFDKPEGRIIESVAFMGDLTKEQVLQFYYLSLPQFGWGKISRRRFYRLNEFLEINFEENEGEHLVKIMIRPTL